MDLVQIKDARRHSPQYIDRLLAGGWMFFSQLFLKTRILLGETSIAEPFSIRIPTKKYIIKKRHAKLLKKNRELFSCKICRLKLDHRHEALFQKQKVRFKHLLHNNLKEIIFGFFPETEPSRLKELRVYHNKKLVSSCIFLQGIKSYLSYICLYDIDFLKHSLGVYTMLEEIAYCQRKQLSYYYLGDVHFDEKILSNYKLSLGTTYFYTQKRWLPTDQLTKIQAFSIEYTGIFEALRDPLSLYQLPFVKFYYIMFASAYLNSNNKYACIKSPLLLLLKQNANRFLLVDYDFRLKTYQLIEAEDTIKFIEEEQTLKPIKKTRIITEKDGSESTIFQEWLDVTSIFCISTDVKNFCEKSLSYIKNWG